jgi:uncharacterized membrane protein
MVKVLVAATIAWPLLLGAVVWQRAVHGDRLWSTLVHVAASRICHQRPERSFQTAGVQWPVCGRCSGLYLGAPAGALAALLAARRGRPSALRTVLALAAIPTAITLGLEWLQIGTVTNLARLLTALPLGAAVAFAVVRVAGEAR